MLKLDTRNQVASAVSAGLIFIQLLAFGAVDAVPAAFFALSQILVCLLLIALLADTVADRFWIELGPVMVLFFAALIWASIPLVLGANPHLLPFLVRSPVLAADGAQLELLKLAGVGAVCLTGALIGLSRSRLQHFIVDFTLIGLVYSFVALWVGQASPVTVLGQPKGAHAFRFTGTFLNANAAGCLFGMIGLLAMGLLQSLLKRLDDGRNRLRDYLWPALAACCVVAAFGACVLTQSRTALLLTAGFGGAIVWIEWRGRADTALSRALPVGAVVMMLLGLGLGASQVSSRWGTLLIDAQLRGEAYRQYLSAIARSPWFGYGLGGFRTLHESILSARLAPAMWDFGAAHSAVTQAALEGGAPFVLLLLMAAGLIVLRIAGVGMGAPRFRRGAVITSILAAASLAFAFSFVDIALNVPALAALWLMLLGAAWGDAVARGVSSQARFGGEGEGPLDRALSSPDWKRQ